MAEFLRRGGRRRQSAGDRKPRLIAPCPRRRRGGGDPEVCANKNVPPAEERGRLVGRGGFRGQVFRSWQWQRSGGISQMWGLLVVTGRWRRLACCWTGRQRVPAVCWWFMVRP